MLVEGKASGTDDELVHEQLPQAFEMQFVHVLCGSCLRQQLVELHG